MPQYPSGGQFGGSSYNNPQMNPMQKQGMPGPQGPPQGQPMPQGPPQGQPMPQGPPQQMGGGQGNIPVAMQWMANNNQQASQRAQELQQAEQDLTRAQMYGSDPYTIARLQEMVNSLRQAHDNAIKTQMIESQREAVNQERAASNPGPGGGRNQNAGAYATNASFDQQLLAMLLSGGGGGSGPRRY